jgi:hypothetical protein
MESLASNDSKIHLEFCGGFLVVHGAIHIIHIHIVNDTMNYYEWIFVDILGFMNDDFIWCISNLD